MQPIVYEIFNAVSSHLRRHPEEIARVVRSALGLRIGVPLVALRWGARHAEKIGSLSDVLIEAVPPGLKIGGLVEASGTPIRFSLVLFIDRMMFTDQELMIALRLEDIKLRVDGEPRTPIGAMIQSGALNLQNVGTLIGYLPNRPVWIAEAKDNRIIIDFMREPKLSKSPLIRQLIGLSTGFITLDAVRTEEKHVDIGLRAFPIGVRGAMNAIRQHAIVPILGKRLRSKH